MSFWQNLFGRRAPEEGEGEKDATRRLQRQLETSAHSVSLRRLRSYGLQSVRVIDASTIQGIVNAALDEALRHRGVAVTGLEREEIGSLARAQLEQLMDENRRLNEAKDEVERRSEESARNRQDLELSVAVLRRELEESQKQLELERERLGLPNGSAAAAGTASAAALIPGAPAAPIPGAPVARAPEAAPGGSLPEWGSLPLPRFAAPAGEAPSRGGVAEAPEAAPAPSQLQRRALRPPSEEGQVDPAAPSPPAQRVLVQAEFSDDQFSKLEGRMRLIFERLLRDKDLFERNGEGDVLPKLSSLEAELKDTLQKLIAESKAQIGANDGGEKVEMLEKRIGKLNEALAQAESALAKLARLKNVDPGVASIYGDVQGLNEDDPDYARKTELLGQVFKENLELQGKPLEDAPPDLAPPPLAAAAEVPAGELAVPAHFETPVEFPADFDFGGDASF